MSSDQTRRPVRATVLGLGLALPLLAGCAYDDGYYAPPADYGYGYGYGYYGYGYGYPCGWPYDCDRWHHRRHHHHHDDDDDGHHGGNDPRPVKPGGHASNIPPEIVRPRDVEPPRVPRADRRGSPPSQIWIPPHRDSRR
jgi:hypothetical protein